MTSETLKPAALNQYLDRRFSDARLLAALDNESEQIYRKLAHFRRKKSAEDEVPPYQIITNREILLVCQNKPTDFDSLKAIGMSPARARYYGEQILELLRDD